MQVRALSNFGVFHSDNAETIKMHSESDTGPPTRPSVARLIFFDFSLIVKVAPHECVIRTGQP